jgi:FdhD protein
MTRSVEIHGIRRGMATGVRSDVVAVEEPLEIRVEGEPVAVAMRTPGQDLELVAGWLLSEGIVRTREDLMDLVMRPGDEAQRSAMVDAMLRDSHSFDVVKHRRNVLTNASCGLCGAASVEQILRDFPKLTSPFCMDAAVLHGLPAKLREEQRMFDTTGGVHACALFDSSGDLLALREDVGRHNALDKLVGWALQNGRLPLSESILLLSGRVSLEMVQKALAAGIPVLAAIGAPSSLAVELAEAGGMCLAGFLRGETFNVYSGLERLRGAGGL